MQFYPDQLLTTTVHDRDGNKVGRVQQVYLNDATGAPSWVTVRTGLFGTNESLVPLDDARLEGDVLQVPFDKQVIRDAPNYDPGHHLGESDEEDLYRYYGMSPTATTAAPTSDRDQAGGERVQQPGAGTEQGHARGDAHRDAEGAGDRPSGEYVSGSATSPGQGQSRHSDQTGEREQPSGEYISGSATPPGQGQSRHSDQSGEREQPSGEYISGSATPPGQGQSRHSDQSGEREHRGRTGQSDSDERDRHDAQEGRDSAESSHERDLLERERDLLQRERDLLDRERELAEQQGSVRPRLRRHTPGERA